MARPPARTVLVIDDEAEFRNLLSEYLRQRGWQVLQAVDGEQGIQSAKTHFPDVVICDLLMARCNGFQVCRSIRGLDSLAHTKIVVTSGRDFESDRRAALDAGASEYVTKPVQLEQMAGLLTRLAAPAPPAAGPVFQNGASQPPSLRVKFYGVRGSIPTPGPGTVEFGGNTSCLEVRAGNQIIILDAGTGLRLLGRDLVAEFGEQPLDLCLLLTHTHWDHIQGLPFFMPVYQPQNRVRIMGFEGAKLGLDTLLSSQMESPFFPIGLRELAAHVRIEELKELQFSLGAVRVEACFAYHPGICVGYRLSAGGRSVAFFPDNELRHAGRGLQPPAADAVEFAREQNQKLADFVRGVDVLIMDAQYDREEYQQHVGWGHGCLDEVVDLALKAGASQLFLFHHDPDHDDAKVHQMVHHARALIAAQNGSLQVDAAREGLVLELATQGCLNS